MFDPKLPADDKGARQLEEDVSTDGQGGFNGEKRGLRSNYIIMIVLNYWKNT